MHVFANKDIYVCMCVYVRMKMYFECVRVFDSYTCISLCVLRCKCMMYLNVNVFDSIMTLFIHITVCVCEDVFECLNVLVIIYAGAEVIDVHQCIRL